MKVAFTTLGCRLNEAEIQSFAFAFKAKGHEISRDTSDAHLLIVNTCAVTSDACRKSRQAIRKLHRNNPTASIVVTGCYATLNTHEAQAFLGVDLVVSNNNKDELVDKCDELLQQMAMPAMATEPSENALFRLGRERAFVKVQDGCRYLCTYCIVTIARGEEKSRPHQEVIDEINALHQQGIQEVVLTGVHLGGYGSDLESNLTELIDSVLAHTQIPRLRLGSLEPWELDEHFFKLFLNPRLQPHLHLPLQSGADSVLRRMSRRCKVEEYKALVNKARSIVPQFNITTDIIVGFPGETEDEWQQTLNQVKEISFGHIHIFSFSPREGTKAARLAGQVTGPVKKERNQALHAAAKYSKAQQLHLQVGSTVPVLWESQVKALDNGLSEIEGYTPNYHRIKTHTENPALLAGKIVKTQIIGAEESLGTLFGAIEPIEMSNIQPPVGTIPVKQL